MRCDAVNYSRTGCHIDHDVVGVKYASTNRARREIEDSFASTSSRLCIASA